MNDDELSPAMQRDALTLFLGRRLGEGVGRRVYLCETDATKVVKIEGDAYSYQNQHEHHVWQQLQGTEWAKYLAPVHGISHSGAVLLMERVLPLRGMHTDKFAGKVKALKNVWLPRFLTDLKRENYGWLNGRIVACDYGSALMFCNQPLKLRKVKWLA